MITPCLGHRFKERQEPGQYRIPTEGPADRPRNDHQPAVCAERVRPRDQAQRPHLYEGKHARSTYTC